jgi:hypothetical protein
MVAAQLPDTSTEACENCSNIFMFQPVLKELNEPTDK